jgi:hypothetical protein
MKMGISGRPPHEQWRPSREAVPATLAISGFLQLLNPIACIAAAAIVARVHGA